MGRRWDLALTRTLPTVAAHWRCFCLLLLIPYLNFGILIPHAQLIKSRMNQTF